MAKNAGKVGEKSGNFVSPEKWEPWKLLLCLENIHKDIFVDMSMS